jgi:WD40 repeat protein
MLLQRRRFLLATCLAIALRGAAGAAPPEVEGKKPDRGQDPTLTDVYGDPLPPGAVARLGTVRLRHVLRDGSGAACVAFSPEGKVLISGGDVGLRAWDVATGKDLGWFRERAPASAACFSPDGKTLITADNKGSIRHWRADNGVLLRQTDQARDGRDRFHGLASFLAADGSVAGVHGMEGGVRLWSAETGKQILDRKEGGRGVCFSGALSPDGKTLAVSGEGNRAHLLEVPTGKEIRQIEGPTRAPHLQPGFARWRAEAVFGFTFSPDGRLLAAAGWGSPRAREASTAEEGLFSVWEVSTGKLLYTVRDGFGRLAFDPTGKHLASGGHEGVIRLYETVGGTEVRRFEPYPGPIAALAFSADGKMLAAAGEYTVVLWDVATGKRLHPVPGHGGPVARLTFSPDAKSLASGDTCGFGDSTVIVWDLKAGKARHSLGGHFPGVLSLAWSPDGATLASGDGYERGGRGGLDAQIRLWEVAEGRLLRQFPGHLNSVQDLAFAPDGRTLASVGGDARAKLWDVATGRRLRQIRGAESQLKSVAFAPDGQAVLVAGTSNELALWRVDSGEKLRDLGAAPEGQWRSVLHAAFLPDGKTVLAREVASGMPGFNEVRLWDADSGRLLRSFPMAGTDHRFASLALAPDGKTLATAEYAGQRDRGIELWDTVTGKRVGRLVGHGGGDVSSLAFAPDGKTLASGGRDTTVLLWDVPRARLVGLWQLLNRGEEEAQAAKHLAAQPAAVPFLREMLQRAADRERPYLQLIADLDHEEFEVRERATDKLEAAGAAAEFALLLALEGHAPPEAQRRIKLLIDKLTAEREKRVAALLPDFEGEKANEALQALQNLAPEAEPVLRRILEAPPDPRDPRRRPDNRSRWFIQQALQRLRESDGDPRPRPRSVLRSVAILEAIGTPEARQALKQLAGGPAGSVVTREAGAALERLTNPR